MANRVTQFLLLALIYLLGASALTVTNNSEALAQISSSTGAIQGTVIDPHGAVVLGAKVVITNTATGVRAEGATLSDGIYIFPLIPPGTYKVEIEAQGFRRAVLPNIVVDVTKVTVANAKLEIGQLSTEVVVNEAAQIVDTRTATTGDVISGDLVKNIPLPAGNFLDRGARQAGVAAPMGNAAALGRDTPQLFVAGQRGTVNNFVLNGVDANNFGNNNLGNVPVPNPDAVQEFRVSTSQYDASQGRGSGGNINVIQRSGGDKFHGSAFDFYRSDKLNANDFFFNRTGTPKPVLNQNQFGGTIGGPIPHLKETFWFFSYQGTRQKNGVSGAVSGSQPVLPATRDAASLAAAFSLTPSQIDPVAVAWLNRPGPYGGLLYPSGTCAGLSAAKCSKPGDQGQFSFSAPSIYNEDQYNATVDRELFHNNRLSGKFFYAKVDQNNPIGGGVSLGQGQAQPQSNTHAAISDTQTITSNLLNEARAGFTLVRSKTLAVEAANVSDIGMTRFNSSIFAGTPAVFFDSGILSWGGISTNNDQGSGNLSYTVADTLSWTRGKHTLRGGAEFRRYRFNIFNNFASRGFLNFPDFTSFLTGTPNDVFVGTGQTDRGFRAYDISGFAQDDYRVTRRLTLNLGLRYDFLSFPTEIGNKLGNFDPSLIARACVAAGGGNCLRAGFVSPAGLGGGFGTPGVSGNTLLNSDKKDFAPRLGLAWDVFGNGRLAFRSGYGIYYIRTSGQTLLQLITAAPFFQLFRTTGTGIIGNKALANPYPALPVPSQFPILPIFPQFNGFTASGAPIFVNPATGLPAPLITINPFERTLRSPYNQSWNASVEYEFKKGWVAELGYLGSRGIRLLNGRQVNTALLVNSANPGLGGLVVNSPGNANARTPIPGFSTTGLNMVTGSGDSWYEATTLSLRHPFTRSFQVKADYTFAKSSDTNSGATTQDLGNSGGNQFVPGLNKGPSIYDQRHRLVVTYLWDIPGPKSSWLGQTLGGWTLSGTTIYQSGFPVNITSSSGGSLAGVAGAGLARADLVPGTCGFTNSGPDHAVDAYINFGCFARPVTLPAGTLTGLTPQQTLGSQSFSVTGGTLYGNSGRDMVRAPWQQRWDLALIKNFPIHPLLGEQGNLQFRAAVFKLFSTPIFGVTDGNGSSIITTNINTSYLPNGTRQQGNFGKLTGTVDHTGRVIQLALKLSF